MSRPKLYVKIARMYGSVFSVLLSHPGKQPLWRSEALGDTPSGRRLAVMAATIRGRMLKVKLVPLGR